MPRGSSCSWWRREVETVGRVTGKPQMATGGKRRAGRIFCDERLGKKWQGKETEKIQEMIQVSRHAPPLLKKANCQFCGRGPLKSAAIFDRRQPGAQGGRERRVKWPNLIELLPKLHQ